VKTEFYVKRGISPPRGGIVRIIELDTDRSEAFRCKTIKKLHLPETPANTI
jgi:hypothetical protein